MYLPKTIPTYDVLNPSIASAYVYKRYYKQAVVRYADKHSLYINGQTSQVDNEIVVRVLSNRNNSDTQSTCKLPLSAARPHCFIKYIINKLICIFY